jgi:hypothetical protein
MIKNRSLVNNRLRFFLLFGQESLTNEQMFYIIYLSFVLVIRGLSL